MATFLPNCLELLEVYWACAKIGAVIVLLSILVREKGLITLLNDSDSRMLVTNTNFSGAVAAIKVELPGIAHDRLIMIEDQRNGFRDYHALKKAPGDHEPDAGEISPEDPFNIMYSSGTTGLPKGIVHTHSIKAINKIDLKGESVRFWGAFIIITPIQIFVIFRIYLQYS